MGWTNRGLPNSPFTQNNHCNVWHKGEHLDKCEAEKFSDNPTWIHGLDNALAGLQ